MKAEQPQGSLQRRVFTVFGSFTLVLCLVYTGIGILAAYVIEDQLLDNLISDEVRYIERQFHARGTLPAPRLPNFHLYPSSGDAPNTFQAALAGGRKSAELFVAGEQHYHLRRLQIGDRPILAADVGNLLTVTHQSGRLLWLLLAALLATTALALWLAHRLVARTIRPLLGLAREVQAGHNDLKPVALSATNNQDEIGFLARTLERSINELQQAQKREAEFTRDVSHELRTGLAIATNTLALSRERELQHSEKQELWSTLTAMERTVATLLALARAESIERCAFDLRPLLEKRLLARREIATGQGFQLDLALPERLPVSGNPRLTELLLDILLDNAIRHAAGPVLQIHTNGSGLSFVNPVEDSTNTEEIFLPGTRRPGSDGLGQGLYLASRILNAQGWGYGANCEKQLFSISIYPA
ncbi:sensor histidine kinase [Microbulbifer yueqingensis]|uniref:histidine kinase n=1 Tax=Microbulbifer yueqingensis TaxID=658219 RepID=A0A1G9CHW1_9GAMM|nr:HAMP domain-containing sensor histidine kinase [Microbulbifer yueqingensis]SDK51230.1 Signal transduction histidine kinase [Microbulbifer yueqingensis]